MKQTFGPMIKDAKVAGIIHDKPQDEVKRQFDLDPLPLADFLGSLPFWCGDDKLHKKNPDYQHTACCCTTHIVGLPRHPATNEEMPLTPFQVDIAYKIINGRKNFGDAIAQMRKALMIHLNKGRQMGFTEIILRIILHLSFSRYKGANVGIIAATNGSLAKKDLRRLARLYKSIPGVVEQWIKNNTLLLVNGTRIEAFAASEEALTGDTKYKCIFMDEAAKWKLVDDTPVFNSILPIVRTNGADLFLVSTPKGPVKMFYSIEEDPQDFILYQYDIWEAEGNLYTKEEIEQMINSSKEDPEQEYLCKYKAGKDSIFGSITIEDHQGKTAWLDTEDEDDNFEESDEEANDASIHWHE